MKKVFFAIFAAILVAIAAINLNIALKSDFTANVTLASLVSLAKGEDPEPEEVDAKPTETLSYCSNGWRCWSKECVVGNGTCPYSYPSNCCP